MIKIQVKQDIGLLAYAKQVFTGEQRKLMNDTVRALKVATPKDTGEARSNWRTAGLRTIENDTPYIDDLNKGTSKQAGPRFIERTLLATGKFLPNGKMVSSK